MSANEFGQRLKFTSFGESHGTALGIVLDGLPAGVEISLGAIQQDLERRRPGQSSVVSARNEKDKAEILSGVFEGKSLGSPIAVLVRNEDAKSEDYEQIKNKARIGHADDLWREKFGHADHRGGGRSSGRETLCRVIAGSIAKQFLMQVCPNLKVFTFTSEIYKYKSDIPEVLAKLKGLSQSEGDDYIDSFMTRFPSQQNKEVEKLLLDAKTAGKSYGGKASIFAHNVPAYLGQPVAHKLKADLAHAYMSIGATHSLSLGMDVDTEKNEGSEFHSKIDSEIYGGIRGGISSGEDLFLQVGFKPTSSVLDVAKKGRHDPCIVPRACPVLQAMTYFVLADHLIWKQSDRIENFCT